MNCDQFDNLRKQGIDAGIKIRSGIAAGYNKSRSKPASNETAEGPHEEKSENKERMTKMKKKEKEKKLQHDERNEKQGWRNNQNFVEWGNTLKSKWLNVKQIIRNIASEKNKR